MDGNEAEHESGKGSDLNLQMRYTYLIGIIMKPDWFESPYYSRAQFRTCGFM